MRTPFDWKGAAQPFLKWAGSKRYLLPEILPRLPKKIKTYYEPFVGGGAVFFALAAEKRFRGAILADTNEELTCTYLALRDHGPDGIVAWLRRHERDHCERYYYDVRSRHHGGGASYIGARMIYLNRTCFNGLYRVNKKGEFNVPFGRYTNPKICDEENLRAVSAALSGISVVHEDFANVVATAGRHDAVYFDPPYVPVSATSSFTAYSAGGFGPKDQEHLRDVARKLIDRGVHVLLSNSDTPFVRKLYRGFKIEKVEAPRRINSKGGKRGNVDELLITGRHAP